MLGNAVVRTDGFDLVDEGTPDSPKIGYVARNPGSSLILSLDTSTPPTHSAGTVLTLTIPARCLTVRL